MKTDKNIMESLFHSTLIAVVMLIVSFLILGFDVSTHVRYDMPVGYTYISDRGMNDQLDTNYGIICFGCDFDEKLDDYTCSFYDAPSFEVAWDLYKQDKMKDRI